MHAVRPAIDWLRPRFAAVSNGQCCARLPVGALQAWPGGFLLKVRNPAQARGSGAACKPGFVLAPGCPGASEDHSSRPTIAGRLEHSHPDTAPGPKPRRSSGPLSTMSLFKLAPGGAYPTAGHPAVARGLLPHDFTLTCSAPRVNERRPSAVYFLRRFPSGYPGSLLATSLSYGARTFLP